MVRVVLQHYLPQAHLSCDDVRNSLGDSNFLDVAWNGLQNHGYFDGSAQNPSESAMLTLVPAEREERILETVPASDLEIQNVLPFLGFLGMIVEIQTRGGKCQHETTRTKRPWTSLRLPLVRHGNFEREGCCKDC